MNISIHVEFGTPTSGPRRPWRRLSAAALALTLLIPMVAVASDSFPDVPDSNPFHNDINRVYGARVAAGCGGGNYCPSGTVTREQMAAFLSRVGGRATYAAAGWSSITGVEADIAVLTIKAGNVLGGTAFVAVNAAISGYTSTATGCPCVGIFRVVRDGGGASDYSYIQLNELAGAFAFDSAALSFAVAVPTGVTQTFRIRGYEYSGTATINARVNATATYLPFGHDGGSSLSSLGITTSSQSSGGTPR
jgi:hypothetical protein